MKNRELEKQIQHCKEAVAVFMKACDQEVNDYSFDRKLLDDKVINLRIKIQLEEIEELKEAIRTNNKVEILDALADNLYIILGTMNTVGVDESNIMFDNMSHINYNIDKMISDNSQYPTYLEHLFDNIILNLMKRNTENGNNHKLNELLMCFTYALVLTSEKFNMPLFPAFDIVHESNMTKVMPDGKVLKNEIGKVIKPATYKAPDLSMLLF